MQLDLERGEIMVGEMTNRPMARFVAAGLLSKLDDVMHRLVALNAIDIIDFDGEDGDEFDLGSPRSDHEDIAKQLTTYRSCLLYTSPSPRDATLSRMPSSA